MIETGVIRLREALAARLVDILEIIELNDNVIRIASSQFRAVQQELSRIGRGAGLSQRIDSATSVLTNLRNNPNILEQKKIVKEQVLVLFTGTLESYVNDVVRLIGNDRPDLFDFEDENEKITFSQAMLKGGFRLGDAILEHIVSNKNHSFQDLKSTLEALKKYLGIEVNLTVEDKDALILLAAARHIILHNSSTINRRFMQQIRNTDYSNRFTLGATIEVSNNFIELAKEAISDFADQLTAGILDKA